MEFILPKEILRLILVRILELEYMDKKKIVMKDLDKYLQNMMKRQFYRSNILNISTSFHTAVYINRFNLRYNRDCPIHYSIINRRIKEVKHKAQFGYDYV